MGCKQANGDLPLERVAVLTLNVTAKLRGVRILVALRRFLGYRCVGPAMVHEDPALGVRVVLAVRRLQAIVERGDLAKTESPSSRIGRPYLPAQIRL